jgi:ABC-type transport system involved in cytochrome c biogenesis ATPase subunit
MLTSLYVENFTVFHDQEFQFSPGLNVIVGENSVGKSHILKLAYAMIATSAEAGRKTNVADPSNPTKVHLQKAYAEKLIGVFRPDQLGRLASRTQGRTRCKIKLGFDDTALNTIINFASSAKTDVEVEQLPTRWDTQKPLYLPTRELLTIFPGFVSVYESHYLAFEETWRDTCIHLGALTLRGAREKQAATLLAPIEKALGGKVFLDTNGHFYLSIPGKGNMEMPLLAEGFRKLAMLARLIANGVILGQSYLFWDEPEANLNPRLIRLAAEVIHSLCKNGVQIFIATHSFFLLKELDMLAKKNPIPQHFISLSRRAENTDIEVEQEDSLVNLKNIITLDEELEQYDREMAMRNE